MKSSKIVDIIGSGPSAAGYDWPDDHDKWSVGSALSGYGIKPDLFFCFHTCDPVEQLGRLDKAFLDKRTYPIDKIVKRFGSSYFTNTIAYMIAYAIFKGYKHINLIGIDMDIGSEYAYERPCILYWIGRAESEGIYVSTTSNLNTTFFMYGYNDASNIFRMIERKRFEALALKEKYKSENKEIAAAGWHGKAKMAEEILNVLRS